MSWFTRLRDSASAISVATDFGAVLRARAGVEAVRARNVNPFSVPLAVVDVETTGPWAEGTDRIAEIGIVHLNQELETVAEYSSLVNPRRDLGATWLHGITGQDIASAPLFSDVVDDVTHWLRGRAIVAYNGDFDLRFLRAEFTRLGLPFPDLPLVDLRGGFDGGTLGSACTRYDIEIHDEHTALGDAQAVAALLRARVGGGEIFASIAEPPPDSSWPVLRYEPTEERRSLVISREPAPGLAVKLAPGDALCFTGDAKGLSLGRVQLTRLEAEQLAMAAGFVVKPGVSKKVTAVVAVDVDSLSGKAQKARALGIPIIPEITFWQSLGYEVTVSNRT